MQLFLAHRQKSWAMAMLYSSQNGKRHISTCLLPLGRSVSASIIMGTIISLSLASVSSPHCLAQHLLSYMIEATSASKACRWYSLCNTLIIKHAPVMRGERDMQGEGREEGGTQGENIRALGESGRYIERYWCTDMQCFLSYVIIPVHTVQYPLIVKNCCH